MSLDFCWIKSIYSGNGFQDKKFENNYSDLIYATAICTFHAVIPFLFWKKKKKSVSWNVENMQVNIV